MTLVGLCLLQLLVVIISCSASASPSLDVTDNSAESFNGNRLMTEDKYNAWKRASANYALKYGGIGKRANPAAVAARILRDANTYSGKNGKRRQNYALKYGGIGKRSTDHIEQSHLHEEQEQMKHEDISKSRSRRSPKLAMKYGGIGKRTSDFAAADSAEIMDKRSPKLAMKYGGIGKRTSDFLEADAAEIMDKRSPKLAMKYGGIGKRTSEPNAAEIMDKRSPKIAMKYGGIGKRTSDFVQPDSVEDMDKRSPKLAMKYGGIGKRTKEFSSADESFLSKTETDKRASKVAMKYAGIGKRSVPDSENEVANTIANESETATARQAQNFHNVKSDDEILIKQRLQAMVKDMEQQYYSKASEKTITFTVSTENATSTEAGNGGKRLKRQIEDDYFTQIFDDYESDESANFENQQRLQNVHNVLEALRRHLLSNTPAESSSDRLHSEFYYPRGHYYSKRKDPIVRNNKYFGIGR